MAAPASIGRLLVLIPAFNEAACIAEVVGGVRATLGADADMLVVSDGSTDDTAQRARDAGATVIAFPFNVGYGAALKAGYTYALRHGYDVVVQLDGDGQHDPASIPGLLSPIAAGTHKVVIGSRFLEDGDYRMPWARRVGQKVFAVALRWLSGKQVTDPTSGFQALHRDVLELYTSDAFPADYPDSDVLLLLHYRGVTFCEAPAQFHSARKAASMHAGWRAGYYIYKMVLSMFLVACRHAWGTYMTSNKEALP